MLVKNNSYGVRHSQTGSTTKMSGSLAAPSPDRSTSVEGDCVSWVMSSSQTARPKMVVSCQPTRLSKCCFWNCSPTSAAATYCVRDDRPNCRGDEDGAHGLVRELDESTLHERDDRHVIPADRDRHLEVIDAFGSDHDVVPFTHSETDEIDGELLDVTDAEDVGEKLDNFDVVIHLAGSSLPAAEWETAVDVNVWGPNTSLTPPSRTESTASSSRPRITSSARIIRQTRTLRQRRSSTRTLFVATRPPLRTRSTA